MHGSSAAEGNSIKNGLIDFTAGSVGKYLNITVKCVILRHK